MKKALLSLLVCVAMAAGCSGAPSAEETVEADTAATIVSGAELQNVLPHRNFIIQSVDGADFKMNEPDGSTRQQPNMSFGQWPHVDGRMCNNYTGQVSFDGELLKMNAASTMMLCVDQELNKLESAFHQMLHQGVKAELEGDMLTLSNDEHVLVFTLFDYVQ